MSNNMLNQLKPNKGATFKAKRVCRGMGSGVGKTGGRGHKGQKSRSGGKVAIGFEGGQNPIYKRVPKRGFVSRKSFVSAQIRLSELNLMSNTDITVKSLQDAGLIGKNILFVKVFLSGSINKAFTLSGIRVTSGAKKAIEKAGGKVAE